jgi:flagellar hook-associated protein 3 FlgL
MRIATISVSATALGQIENLTQTLSNVQNQIATGQRISKPEDDPAAVGRIIGLQVDQQQLAQYQQNASQALLTSQASSSALTNLKSLSDRASEIATIGSSSGNASDATAYATETNQLLEQAVQFANTASGGSYLFAGTAVDSPPFQVNRDASGNITSVTYAGSATAASIPLSASTSISAGTDPGTNQGLADFMNHLVSLRDALNQNDPTAAAAVSTSLDTTENTIINAISEAGAIQSRIQVSQTQMTSQATVLGQSVSNDRDVDVSQAMVTLSQTQVAYQAALQSTTTIMSKSLLDYL